jgi:hypothetical protein
MNNIYIRHESEPYFSEDNIFDTICFDGYAILTDGFYDKLFIVKYPKILDLTIEEIENILNYCGLENLNEIDFYSVYLKYGKLTKCNWLYF